MPYSLSATWQLYHCSCWCSSSCPKHSSSHISRSHASQFPLLRYPQVPDRTHSLHQSRSLHLTQSRSTSQDFRFWLLPLDTLPWAKGYATTTRGFFKHARADGTIILVGCSITAVRTHYGLRRAPVIFGKSARITIVLGWTLRPLIKDFNQVTICVIRVSHPFAQMVQGSLWILVMDVHRLAKQPKAEMCLRSQIFGPYLLLARRLGH